MISVLWWSSKTRTKAMIYFTSDFHFDHDKPFVFAARGFSDVKTMNRQLVDNYNAIVTDEDDVYILGDLMLGDNSAIDYIRQLKGRLHIIRGNHDTGKRMKMYQKLENVVEVNEGMHLNYGKYHFFLCHYPVISFPVGLKKLLKQGTICICGHTHTTNSFNDIERGIIYHVEVDAHQLKPVSIDEVLNDLKEYFASQES